MSPVDYVEFDEFADVEASLLLLETCLDREAENQAFFKGAIHHAHNALNSACVCLLTDTSGLGALDNRSTQAEVAYLKSLSSEASTTEQGKSATRPTPQSRESRLDNLKGLLKRLPGGLSVTVPGEVNSGTSEREKALKWLIHLRDEFEHFAPKTWYIERALLPAVLPEIVRLIREITVSAQYQRANKFSDTAVAEILDRVEKRLSALYQT